MPSEPRRAPALEAAAATVGAHNRTARRVATHCGDGAMVWRVWGAGEPVVLLLGGYGSWTHWIRNIPELSRHYELWVPDMPGLGSSALPPVPQTPPNIAGTVAAGLTETFPPQDRLRLVGFSFGGHVATLAAAQLGTRVRVLTLVGVAALGLPQEPREPFAKERTGMSWEERAQVHRRNLEILMFADPANIDPLAVYLQAENVRRAPFPSRAFAGSDELPPSRGSGSARRSPTARVAPAGMTDCCTTVARQPRRRCAICRRLSFGSGGIRICPL